MRLEPFSAQLRDRLQFALQRDAGDGDVEDAVFAPSVRTDPLSFVSPGPGVVPRR
ncbi:hypothetical protein [Halostella pelagica]|uniref:hypothetical protein n=1 Tax=Halostella pelagica TaxID=2583824 RepID=UPI0013872D84|nr:hypothetical protein [Halostella pelagica]